MTSEATAREWQSTIITDCESILKRELTRAEATFIRSRAGFIALEMIHDHIRDLAGKPEELRRYLRSESEE